MIRSLSGYAAPTLVKKKLEEFDGEAPEIQFPQLQQHDMDVPEEPEKVRVVTHVWNADTSSFVEKDLGELMLVPTGCENADEVSPYENCVTFRSALPRDKEKDMNLFSAYRKEALVGRDWVRNQIDEDIDGAKEDRAIADDIPLMLAMAGTPETGQGPLAGGTPPAVVPEGNGVAQTPGLSASKAPVTPPPK